MNKRQPDVNFKHGQVKLFVLLAVLGIIAAQTHVHIPHTEVLIDGRWAFGFLGFALLRRWWAALALGALLSYPYGTAIPLWIGFGGNMLYAVPTLLVIRPLSNRMQKRWGPDWQLWLGWSALILACYQVFTTPVVWAVIALMEHQPVWPHVLNGWKTQPFFVESILVALFSATAMVALVALKQFRVQQQRLAHVNSVLLGIRNVNQLIVTEDDPQNLVALACVNLTDTMGYLNAWIALFGGEAGRSLGLPVEQSVSATAAAGFEGGFETMKNQMESGDLPPCVKQAIERDEIIVTGNPPEHCPDCPLSSGYDKLTGFARRLHFNGVTYGILSAAVPAEYAGDKEERELFDEVAGDLAYALHKIASARKLEENRRHLGLVVEGSGVGTWEWNVQTNETRFNEQWAAMLGYTIEELTPYDYTTWERLVHPEDLEQARQALADCVAGRTTDYNCEFRMQHKDGRWVWILDRGRVMTRDDAGNALSMFGTHTDITDLKQAEEALRKAHELSGRIIEDGPVGITTVNCDGEIVFANRQAERLFGLEKSDIQSRCYNAPDWKITAVDGSFFPDEELPFCRVMATGRAVHDVQHAIIRKDGARRILCINGAPLHDAQGGIERVVFAILDITESKQGEEKLRAAEETYRNVFLNAQVGIFRTDIETGLLLDANDAVARFCGYRDRVEMLAAPFRIAERYVNPGDREKMAALLRADGEVTDFEAPFRRNDGSTILMRFSARLAPDKGWIEGVSVDVTRERQTEEALRQSEQRFRSFVENANDMVYALSPEGVFTYMSPNWLDFIGEPAEQAIGKSFEPYVHPEDVHLCRAFLEKTLTTGEKQSSVEYRVRHRDGSWRWHVSNGSPVRDETGTVTGYIGIARDMTEAKQAEEALVQSEKNYRDIFDNSSDCIFIHDAATGAIVDVNRTTCETFGYSVEEVKRLNVGDFSLNRPPYTNAEAVEWIRKTYMEGPQRFEWRAKDRKGRLIWFENRLLHAEIGGKNRVLVFGSNIDHRKRAEADHEKFQARLQQAQKMEAIGALAGGIAHDFNNLLCPIVGMSEMLLEDIPCDSLEYDNLREILTAGKRGSELVKQILAFSRQSEGNKIPVRIQQVLKEVIKMVRATIPASIAISQHIDRDCGLVMADPTQLHQIAMNLITNAYHAVDPANGHISIQLKEVVLEPEILIGRNLEPGSYALLTVSDNGCGIAPDNMDKIFDPYFTTKEQGKGTGIGLSTVYGIVKEHGGDIQVYSELEKGTSFNIYLPLRGGVQESPSVSVEETIPSGNERILLVDDEEAIARLEKQMLERLGYRVTFRVSSLDALEAFKAAPDSYDLVITDMTMPNMTGNRLAEELIAIRSDIPVIICTGFSEQLDADRAKALGIKGFLMKPIVRNEMANLIREVLDD